MAAILHWPATCLQNSTIWLFKSSFSRLFADFMVNLPLSVTLIVSVVGVFKTGLCWKVVFGNHRGKVIILLWQAQRNLASFRGLRL
jgi:hypothetical protein